VHAALAWLHTERKAGRPPALPPLFRMFDADWYAQLIGPETVTFDESPERLAAKGKELLALYVQTRTPWRPVAEAELPFLVPLIHPVTGESLPVPIRGYIDLIEEDDTLVEIKTSQRRWNVDSLPDNLQLTTYSYAYQMLFGRAAREVKLVNLVKNRTPVIETHTTERTVWDHERLFHVSRSMLTGVQAGVFIPNRGCWLCRDCEYAQDCLEWTGNEEAA
jgi:hypothetical protein